MNSIDSDVDHTDWISVEVQQVTIGMRGPHGVPKILGHVDIGAGAKIVGPVKIGPHATIGAKAAISRNIKGGMTAAGSRKPELTTL
jgi:serine acetyltransferase